LSNWKIPLKRSIYIVRRKWKIVNGKEREGVKSSYSTLRLNNRWRGKFREI